MQYYSVGIIGTIILLGLYFICFFYSLFKILHNFNFKNIMLLLGSGMFLLAAYFSGNLLNATSTIIPISFVLGIMVLEVKKQA